MMTGRERVIHMLNHRAVDVPALACYVTQCGLYEHGDKLIELFEGCPDDFRVKQDYTLSPPKPEDFDSDGNYHIFETDRWGAVWEKRIFGIMGHPVKYPLEDMSILESYKLPLNIYVGTTDLATFKAEVAERKKTVYVKEGHVTLFESVHAMRSFEDVLMDIMEDTPEINRLVDRLCEHFHREVDFLIAAGVDGVNFGDDFGMETGMLISPAVWRRFFKPRYEEMMRKLKKAGIAIFFHSCGNITDILPDLAEIGVNSVWTQLSCYKMEILAAMCRDLNMAALLHIDRAQVMTKGTTEDVRRKMDEMVTVFKPHEGGSYLYIEIDNGFPYENVEALFGEIKRLRTL